MHTGKTKSGKSYDLTKPCGGTCYDDFTSKDHEDVADHHKKVVGQYYSTRRGMGSEQHLYHAAQVNEHKKEAARKDRIGLNDKGKAKK